MRRLVPAGLLLPVLLLLAGCSPDPDPDRWFSLGVQPCTVIGGAPTKPGPGWGVEGRLAWLNPADWMSSSVMSPFRLAWSHHEGEPGWPDAEYLRLGAAFGVSSSRDLGGVESSHGVTLTVGAAYYQLLVDGPGDRGGPGLLIEPEYWIAIEGRVKFSLGCTVEGWVSWQGDFIGSLSPYLRFGFAF